MADVVTCPACNGTRLSHNGKKACHNCGGQTMHGVASGKTYTRADGTACLHNYRTVPTGWKHVTRYQCEHCPYSYDLDSGD